ncbi:S-adenosyl-L-methionine-dependent methyltransferase [Biscogniauxia sp. FL1348]|nr:S-adenosyl-L-methionine-dependent methyltransferase [Biscogniauxia sp. FL1348]
MEEEITEVINLDEETLLPQQHSGSVSLRNPPIRPVVRFSSYQYKAFSIKKGTVVQIPRRPRKELSWEFLEVSDTYRKGDIVILRGTSLTRQRYLKGMLPRSRNEVCAVLEVEKDDNRDWYTQAAVEIPVTEVVRIRQLRKTNALYPCHKFDDSIYLSKEAIETRAPLVQRWIFVSFYKSSKSRREHRSVSGILRRLTEAEVTDPALRVSDSSLRNAWRGGIVPGGSFLAGRQSIPATEINETFNTRPIERSGQQRYSAGDIFCGAGGASLGMSKAGFEVVVACDMDPAACQTHRANFPRTGLQEMHVYDFVKQQNESRSRRHTDVVHISPPCQTWSPAHTIAGQNDDANMAALFSCGDIIAKERPRITTGEQTFGLLFGRFEAFFNSLVFQYTSLGYSFEWDILNLSHYGLVQPRRRAVWIASCPGEALPPFPAPTHIDKPVTVRQVLRAVGPRASLHNLAEMHQRARFRRPAYDDRAPLRRTITTGCADNYHPSGLRNFTIRELAMLQGFPVDYQFRGNTTQIKRQIGNAFPPTVVSVLYRHIHAWLLQQDNVVEQIIDIDDDAMVIDLDPGPRDPIFISNDEEYDRRGHPEAIVIDSDSDIDHEDWMDFNEDDNPLRLEFGIDSHQQTVVIYDSSDDDDEVMEYDDDNVTRFSRESSRTLSIGSDQDMEIDLI